MSLKTNELDLFYKENFSKDEIEVFLENIAITFVNKNFIEELINNHVYEKDIFKLILNLIINELIKQFQSTQEFSKKFANYILKKHLTVLFEVITELLLEEIAYTNENVIEFFKYYSQDIIVYEDKRYKVPELKGKDGLRWSIVSMLGIVKIYVKAKDYINKIEVDKDELESKIKALYVDYRTPIEHNHEVEKEFKSLDERIKKNADKINILHESLEVLKSDDDIQSINKELEEFKDKRLKLRDEKKLLIKKRINQSVIFNYEGLLRQLENIQRQTKAEYKILEQNEKSFQSIKSAMTKALLSKKQPV